MLLKLLVPPLGPLLALLILVGVSARDAGAQGGNGIDLLDLSADWPPDELVFRPGFLEPDVFVREVASEVRLIWQGPLGGQAFLGFRPPPLPVTIEAGVPFVLGSLRFSNFSTALPGPIDAAIELILEFDGGSEIGPFLLPLQIDHTSDSVLDIASCPEGSLSICDDILELPGGEPVEISEIDLTVLGFDDLDDPATSLLAPENATTIPIPVIAVFNAIPVPEPSGTATLLLSAGLWAASRRRRRPGARDRCGSGGASIPRNAGIRPSA